MQQSSKDNLSVGEIFGGPIRKSIREKNDLKISGQNDHKIKDKI